jgi:hypothetical protein
LDREAKEGSQPLEFLLPRDRAILPRIPKIPQRLQVELSYITHAAFLAERLELADQAAIFLEALSTECSPGCVLQVSCSGLGNGDGVFLHDPEFPIPHAVLRRFPGRDVERLADRLATQRPLDVERALAPTFMS